MNKNVVVAFDAHVLKKSAPLQKTPALLVDSI